MNLQMLLPNRCQGTDRENEKYLQDEKVPSAVEQFKLFREKERTSNLTKSSWDEKASWQPSLLVATIWNKHKSTQLVDAAADKHTAYQRQKKTKEMLRNWTWNTLLLKKILMAWLV